MTVDELIAALTDDPFNTALRGALALKYASDAEYEKALKQFQLITRERELSLEENKAKLHSLSALGFDDEAAQLAESIGVSTPTPNEVPAEESKQPALKLVQGTKHEPAEVVPLNESTTGKTRFSDIGGLEETKNVLRLQIIEPFLRPEIYKKFKKSAGGGVLLYGPPGCGKTMLARAIATECGAEFIPVRISDVLSRWIGDSEENLSSFFEKARSSAPSLLFFDELDALAYSRSKSSSEYSRTLVNEFLNQLDGVGFDNEGILFLAATNMPWDVDAAMKRPGRFARQVFIPPPDRTAREVIIEGLLRGVPAERIDQQALAKRLEGFSGADVAGLIDLAKENVLNDILSSGNERNLLPADIDSAFNRISPSIDDWLRTVKNLVKYSGADQSYKDVAEYLKMRRML